MLHWESSLDLWRTALTIAGLIGVAVNVSLAVAVVRHRGESFATPLWLTYSLAAAGTMAVSAYFRTRDQTSELPLNVGDFTALVPIVGFLAAGTIGWRILGRIVGRAELDKL